MTVGVKSFHIETAIGMARHRWGRQAREWDISLQEVWVLEVQIVRTVIVQGRHGRRGDEH